EHHPIIRHYRRKVPRIFRSQLFENFFHIHQILALLYSLPQNYTLRDVVKGLEAKRGFRLKIQSQEKIPSSGPLIVVANHPHIFVDQFSLGCMIEIYRPGSQIKIVTDNIPEGFDDIYPYSEKVGKTLEEKRIFRENIDTFLQAHGTLIILPGGKLNYRHWLTGMRVEGRWRSGALHFAKNNNTPILPVYISSKTTFIYNFLSNFLPRSYMQNFNFRQALKKEMYIGLTVGDPIYYSEELTPDILREKVYELGDDVFTIKNT
ncbi:1-acyl-sn-glycerol-3-phosphate acyltransferase, partial [Candidatus Gracilibacteria bacterium]|nr:1-acyl-sn-glycerol-3-phosphate acyltransferase [Candidatus Gracilibacteria bacterium]